MIKNEFNICSPDCNICNGYGWYWNGEGEYEECPNVNNIIPTGWTIIKNDFYEEKYPHIDIENFENTKKEQKDD